MFIELKLSGSYHAMGINYGKAFKKEIRSLVNMFHLGITLSKKPGSELFKPNMRYLLSALLNYKKDKIKWQYAAQEHQKFIDAYYPQGGDFMKGIAEGAGLCYSDILHINVSMENMFTCSAWGASGTSTKNNEPIIGMNGDDDPALQKYYRMLDIQPEQGYRFRALTVAGWIFWAHSMNEKGLACALKMVFQIPQAKREAGVPALILCKALNTCSTVEEVREYFESLPNVASGFLFYFADSEKFMKVECCPAGRDYDIVKNGTRGTTNMAHSDLARPYNLIPHGLDESINAVPRQLRMSYLLKKYDGKIDWDIMHAIASDHGDKESDTYYRSMCQHKKILKYNFKTISSFIAVPRKKSFWIFEGNPCENKVTKYEF
ncbi:MAG: C45 family peptidase [Spirochaetes bacterium]|nr:C45 family peptidase [Spirochaetota bacterium]